MKPKRRRMLKHTRDQLREMDYLHKLSPEERAYLNQFLLEFFQADFSYEKPIHPPKYIKDCRDRNNAAKRQIHSVGSDILNASAMRAEEAQYSSRLADKYYTPHDYIKIDLDDDEDDKQ